MENITTRLSTSRENLACQGRALWTATRDASASFATDTSSAARKFYTAAGTEGHCWVGYAQQRRNHVWRAQRRRLATLDRSAFERGMLVQIAHALELLQGRVAQRLGDLAASPTVDPALPLGDYEVLTAKAIVAQLDGLSTDECRAVHTFEENHKRRSTVLRALEQRMAA